MSNVPKGGRGIVSVKFGNKNYYSKVKIGTIKLLGLNRLSDTDIGKNKAEIRGCKAGSHSYRLLLTSRTGVGGVTVKTVDFPVDNRVGKTLFRKWAQSHGNIAGMTTPWGVTEYWNENHPSLKKDGLGQRALDAAGNVINNAAAGALDSLGNAVGGGVQNVENTAGSLLNTVGSAILNEPGQLPGQITSAIGIATNLLGHL